MVNKIAVLEPRSFSGRSNYKENKVIAPRLEYSAMTAFDTPNAFYNRQLIQRSKISDINFGFHLKDVPALHCPCCGSVMYTKKQIVEMSDKLKDAVGPKIKEALIPYLHNLHSVEKDVALILINLSSKFPEKNIKELLKETVGKKRLVLEAVQTNIIKGLIKDAKHIQAPSKVDIVENLKIIKDIVKKGKDGLPFKRKKVIATIDHFFAFEDNLKDKKVLSKMSKKAEKLPSSVDNTNAFIVKYTQKHRSLEEIALRIFESNSATKEHIKPKLRNAKDVDHGSDRISNAMSMCKKCNNERNDSPYYVFVKKHPEMIENIKRHFIDVQNYIIRNDKEDYYTYPLDVKKAINQQSTPPGENTPKLDFSIALIEEYIELKIAHFKEIAQTYRQNKK